MYSDADPSYTLPSPQASLCEKPEPYTENQMHREKRRARISCNRRSWVSKRNRKEGRVKGNQERKLGPEIDEITVGEDGVGLAEFLVYEGHDKG